MKILLDYNLEELEEIVMAMGEPKFRAKQLLDAMYNGKNFGEKININKSLLEKIIDAGAILQPIEIYKAKESKDGSVKFLYKLYDGNIIEGVLLKYAFGNSICVSTQVGCKMNCAFCASGLNGFVRNLSAGEILGQIIAVNKYLGGNLKDRKISNIVLMGSGEPLDNFDNVARFLSQITSESLYNFSVRNITISTCGLAPKIEKLADLGYNVTLSISLHAPNDTIRKQIMPIAKSYPISAILESAKYYNLVTSRRITIEYTLIEGVNNTPNHAMQLVNLLTDFPCHVNLIRLNEVEGRSLKAPTIGSCKQFLNILTSHQISATLRRSLGDDIEGACGQLRNKELKEKKD
ncbi:MAG: 23S rRNA (adenine(2503)-C(2))-methyltransferase RlmN [Clostridiales bacterium]|nr:23S rRNA (adenine(2503)-C(2))-methyltransferase RlmN [Clostridiales bacterium]